MLDRCNLYSEIEYLKKKKKKNEDRLHIGKVNGIVIN